MRKESREDLNRWDSDKAHFFPVVSMLPSTLSLHVTLFCTHRSFTSFTHLQSVFFFT